MTYVPNITVIVTNAVAVNLRELSRRLDKGDCNGMFTTGLNAIGSAVGAPITHWVSSGHVPAAYLNAVTNNVRLFNLAKAAWQADGDVFPFSQAQVTTALAACSLSDGTFTSTIDGITAARPEDPHAFIARKGLQLARTAV
jgi:hypothetical protein